MSICLHILHGCFLATTVTETVTQSKYLTHTAKIRTSAHYRKSLQSSALDYEAES